MDHVVYVGAKAKELDKLLSGEKTMIIRGATGRKMPYGKVNAGDWLYLIENDGSGVVRAQAQVTSVFNSDKMDAEESTRLVNDNMDKLQLSDAQFKKWSGKRYLVLIEVSEVEALDPFPIDKREYGNMDDWLPVEDINTVWLK
jgi:hypothetical protein